jgi:hypothetical protein
MWLGERREPRGGNCLPLEEKEQEMKNIFRIIGVSLASMAGVLLVGGVAWAQAEETPIKVRVVDCRRQGDPDREWVDEDGIEHARDEYYLGRRSGDMTGLEVGFDSWDGDPASDHYFERGYYSWRGRIRGGELTTGVGRYTFECNRIEGVRFCTAEDVMQLEGGGLVKLSATSEDGPLNPYSGFVLETPGGEKRNGPRPRRKK